MTAKAFVIHKRELRAVIAALGFTLNDMELFRLAVLAERTQQGRKSA